MLTHIFGAAAAARVDAFLSQFGWSAGAVLFIVAGLLLLSLPIKTIERIPFVGSFVSSVRLTLAYVLIGIGAAMGAFSFGTSHGRVLEREIARAELQRIAKANQGAIDKAKDAERARGQAEFEKAQEAIIEVADAKAAADKEIVALRERIAADAAKDPKAASAQAPTIILDAIRGGFQK